MAAKPLGVFRYAPDNTFMETDEGIMKKYQRAGKRVPMHIIFGPRKVSRQIEEYAKWKGLRFSGAAATHRRELIQFVKKAKICCVEEITPARVNAYLDSINSMALKSIALRAMQGFLYYCRLMGYVNVKFTSLVDSSTMAQMTTVHPLLRVDKVKRAKELRAYQIEGKPMSYRAIKAKMESEDHCIYDVHAIYRWVNYHLPELSTG